MTRRLAMLPPELAARGPKAIGATGGSGTRAFVSILQGAGLFVGADLNRSRDALGIASYLECWINVFLVGGDDVPPWVADVAQCDLLAKLREHCARIDGATPWGWKEPRTLLLLPFLSESLPSLRFVHVVRDGRDMAFSGNQNQLRKHGGAYLRRPVDPASPADSIELWGALNLSRARYGEERLGDRYLRVRYEDLCAKPAETAARVLGFFELDGDPAQLAAHVEPPLSLGRWRSEDPATISYLESIVPEALELFGYT